LNRFEAPFIDVKTGCPYTQTFWEGEPVLYHPPHKASPVPTHIATIAHDFFTCGDSTTSRMIPLRHAQHILLKLSLSDIDAATKSSELNIGERVWWKRWFNDENWRTQGKQRISAPCCGRILKRYQLEVGDGNVSTCPRCKVGDWVQPPSAQPEMQSEPPAEAPQPEAAQQCVPQEVVPKQGEEQPEAVQKSAEKQQPQAAQHDEEKTQPEQPASPAAANPSDNLHPWQQTAEWQPQKRYRVSMESGVVTSWHQRYGFARFIGYEERVLIHRSDCIDQVQVGDSVTGQMHRRRDGKLQCFKVSKLATEAQQAEHINDVLLGLA